MKRKILFLMAVMGLSNVSLVSACSFFWRMDLPHDNLTPPISYDLNLELLKLNQLDFKLKNSIENFSDYQFKSSWFAKFVAEDNNKIVFAGKEVSKTQELFYYYQEILTNNSENKVEEETSEKKIVIDAKCFNRIFLAKDIDLGQEFIIFGGRFNFGNNTIKLGKKIDFNMYSETFVNFKKQEFSIPPHSSYVYWYQLFVKLTKFEGILKFNLNNNTKIAYQVENKLTKENKIYTYTINDLFNRYATNQDYQKELSKKESFFTYDNGKLLMQLEASFELESGTNTFSYIGPDVADEIK